MDFETEHFFICPYCAQEISMLLEELYSSQTYIEDCQTCCNPIEISYTTQDGQVTAFNVQRTQ